MNNYVWVVFDLSDRAIDSVWDNEEKANEYARSVNTQIGSEDLIVCKEKVHN